MTTVKQGSRLAVNLAPFIGSSLRSKDRIPCRALAVAENRVLVRVDPPFRPVDLWVEMGWVEGVVEGDEGPGSNRSQNPMA